MKKNITINLAGHLFAIDEDAYDLLLNYTETLRRYYRRQAEGEEVVDDIEARIAELFNEKIALGYNAITIEHVQDVIQRIGNLEDLTSSYYEESNGTYSQTETGNTERPNHLGAQSAATAAGEAVRGAWNKLRSGKRFYRDTENKMLAGVLAGCAKYFGGDTVIWRLVFLLLVFMPIPFLDELHGITGALVILYIILAIIAPATSTPEDVLKMRGEEVTPQKLAEEVTRQNNIATANEQRAQRRHAMKVILAIVLVAFSVACWIGFTGVLCGAGALYMFPESMADEMFSASRQVPAEAVASAVNSVIYLLSAIELCLFVLGYCSMHTGLTLLDKVKSMGLLERLSWLIVFIVSVVAITLTGVYCAQEFKIVEEGYSYQWEHEEVAPSTDFPSEADSTDVVNDSTAVLTESTIQAD